MEETVINDLKINIIKSKADCKKILTDIKGLTILHMNIRSIEKNYEELLIMLQEINTEPHIIILMEVWEVNNLNLFKIDNYTSHYSGEGVTKCAGIIVYIKNELNHITEIHNINTSKIIKIKITDNNKAFEIFAIYRSHQIKIDIFIEVNNF